MSTTVLYKSSSTDYTLVAKCGKKIKVHKCILCIESDFFRSLFASKTLKVEDELQTDANYSDLKRVVKWMYVYKHDTKESQIRSCDGVIDVEIYELADKYMIANLLDWDLYISLLMIDI